MNDAGDWIRDCDAVRDSVQIEIPHWNQNNNNTFRGTLRRSSLSSSKEKNNNRGDGVEWGRTCSGGPSLGWRQPREFQLARRTTTSDHLRVAAAAAPLTWGLESTRYDSTPATTTRRRKGRGSSSSSNNEKNGAYIIYNQDSVDLCTLLESFLRRTTTTTTVGVSACPSLPVRVLHIMSMYMPRCGSRRRGGVRDPAAEKSPER